MLTITAGSNSLFRKRLARNVLCWKDSIVHPNAKFSKSLIFMIAAERKKRGGGRHENNLEIEIKLPHLLIILAKIGAKRSIYCLLEIDCRWENGVS